MSHRGIARQSRGGAARLRRFATVAALTAVVVGALPALAQACTPSSAQTNQAFAPFGDLNEYWLVPGGSFENGAPGWGLTNAWIASGNEPWYVGSASDSQSLSIGRGGNAISPPICVSASTPSFRFFVRESGPSWGQMNVSLQWTDSFGMNHNTVIAAFVIHNGWRVLPPFGLGNSGLPLWEPGGTLTVRVEFTPVSGGQFGIDDVYVDPWGRG